MAFELVKLKRKALDRELPAGEGQIITAQIAEQEIALGKLLAATKNPYAREYGEFSRRIGEILSHLFE